MSLGSPRFERELRALAWDEVRTSRELKKERRLARGPRRLPGWLSGGFFVLLFCVFALRGSRDAAPEAVILGLTLLSFGLAICLVQWMTRILYSSPELAVVAHHPISDAEFFTFQVRRFRWIALAIFAISFAVFSVLADRSRVDFHDTFPAVIGAAALHAGLLLSVALILGRFLHLWWKAWWIGGAFILVGVAVVLGSTMVRGGLRTTFGLEIAIPTGWASGAFHHAVLNGRPGGWILAGLALTLVATMPWFLKALRWRYWVPEITLSGAGIADAQVVRELAVEAAAWSAGARPTAEDRASARASFDARMEDLVRSRFYLAPVRWASLGWIEAVAGAWMSARERIVAEFLTAETPGWTRAWKRALGFCAAGVALLAATRGTGGVGFVIMLLIAGTISGFGAFGFGWPGFRLTASGLISSPAFAPFPIRLGEVAAVLAKVHIVRTLAMAVPVIASATLVAVFLKHEPRRGAEIGLYVVLLSLAILPGAITVRFLDISREGTRLWLQRLAMIPFALLLIFAIPFCAVVPFLAAEEGWQPFLGVAGAAAASLVVAGAGWMMFRFGRRDFLRPYGAESL